MTELGRLTTHVLDIARGQPVAGLKIELWSLGPERRQITSAVTNSDGRCTAPLLQGAELNIGTYELNFLAGDYLRSNGAVDDDPAFLDVIPIRFGINNTNQHYHIPLLLSPYGYSTYRGS